MRGAMKDFLFLLQQNQASLKKLLQKVENFFID